MVYTTNIPQANDLISNSQSQILGNFQYLGDTTGNITNPGYYKLPNGLVLNWGRIDVTTAGNKTQSYAQAYTSAVYSLQFSLAYASAGDIRDIPIVVCIDSTANIPLSLSTAKFRVSNATTLGNTLYIFWYAIGV